MRTYDLGVNSFITKPVTFDGLVEAMTVFTQYWFEIVALPSSERPPCLTRRCSPVAACCSSRTTTRTTSSPATCSPRSQTPVHELYRARDFDAAVETARTAVYDVCFVDYRLGGAENGIDLARELIEDGNKMPVILLTGTRRPRDRRARGEHRRRRLPRQGRSERGDARPRDPLRNPEPRGAACSAGLVPHDRSRPGGRARAARRPDRRARNSSHGAGAPPRRAGRSRSRRTTPSSSTASSSTTSERSACPTSILLKPGQLDRQELGLMKRHVTLGAADPRRDPVPERHRHEDRRCAPRALGRHRLPERDSRGARSRSRHGSSRSSTPSTR